MIKTILLTVSTASLLFLTGCGQTAPEPSKASKNNISNASPITGDAVSINETNYAGASNNSSSNGFASVYFDFGDYGISSGMERAVAHDVSVAAKSASKIKIEGNCDEFGTDEYNYALGLKRAKAVKDALVAQGVRSSKVVMVSFGESNPLCSAPSDSCYAKNRRVDLRLIK